MKKELKIQIIYQDVIENSDDNITFKYSNFFNLEEEFTTIVSNNLAKNIMNLSILDLYDYLNNNLSVIKNICKMSTNKPITVDEYRILKLKYTPYKIINLIFEVFSEIPYQKLNLLYGISPITISIGSNNNVKYRHNLKHPVNYNYFHYYSVLNLYESINDPYLKYFIDGEYFIYENWIKHPDVIKTNRLEKLNILNVKL